MGTVIYLHRMAAWQCLLYLAVLAIPGIPQVRRGDIHQRFKSWQAVHYNVQALGHTQQAGKICKGMTNDTEYPKLQAMRGSQHRTRRGVLCTQMCPLRPRPSWAHINWCYDPSNKIVNKTKNCAIPIYTCMCTIIPPVLYTCLPPLDVVSIEEIM